jgi:hypothetical protein
MIRSTIVIKNAAINVVKTFLISKSSIILSVSQRRNALITNLNKPNVIMINGRVNRMRSQPVKKLITL